jgi:hypothetical protein
MVTVTATWVFPKVLVLQDNLARMVHTVWVVQSLVVVLQVVVLQVVVQVVLV